MGSHGSPRQHRGHTLRPPLPRPNRTLPRLSPGELSHSDRFKTRDGEGTGHLDSEALVRGLSDPQPRRDL